MIPNKKGLKVIIKGYEDPEWKDKILTLTGGKEVNVFGLSVFYPVEEYDSKINVNYMVPLNSLKLLILNKKEKEN